MTLDLRFHPLTEWPVTPTPANQRGGPYSFRSKWNDTLVLLEDELDRLKAGDVVISVALAPEDIRIDGWPRSNAKPPRHPGVILSFDSRHGPLRYLTDRYVDWRHNVRAIALGLGALRAVDRYGITERGEQYVGWKAIPASTSNGEAPKALLSRLAGVVVAGANLDTKAIYRRALRSAHPDHGGSRELLEQVQDAGRKLGVA